MKPILALLLKVQEAVVHLQIIVTWFYAPQLAGLGWKTWRTFDPVTVGAVARRISRHGQP